MVRSVPARGRSSRRTSAGSWSWNSSPWRSSAGVPANCYARAGVPVPVHAPGEVADRIWSAVTRRTRVLAVSHITSPTALTFPLAELIGRARSSGILTVVDGSRAPGQIPIDLRELCADFYAANCHKWLCAPKGTGFLFARRDPQDRLRPPHPRWGDESDL